MKTTVRLTESAVMLSAAFVLSLIPVMQMPFGGDVTLASMLPVLLIAYRHGTPWGLLVGFAGSLLQLLTGLSNLSYATSAWAAIAIILLDYTVAFTVLGLGGIFRRFTRTQGSALMSGALLCCALRYVCHVISGCTVWAGVSIPDTQGLLYSLSYNAAYMVPETIITIAAALALSVSLDFSADQPRRATANNGKPVVLIAALCAIVFATVGAVCFFQAVQTEEGYSFAAVTTRDWWIISGCALLAIVSAVVSAATKKK